MELADPPKPAARVFAPGYAISAAATVATGRPLRGRLTGERERCEGLVDGRVLLVDHPCSCSRIAPLERKGKVYMMITTNLELSALLCD